MPVTITSVTFADEFNSGTTTNLNALVGDKITATIDCYYENDIDAGALGGQAKMKLLNGSNSNDVNLQNLYASNIIVYLSSGVTQNPAITSGQINELLGNEITTTGFSTNYTGNVIAIFQNVEGTNTALVLDTTGTENDPFVNNATIYYSGTIESIRFGYRFNGSTGNVPSPALIIQNSLTQEAEFANTSNVLDASSAAVISIPFKYDGAYQTGSLTVQGQGLTTTRQSFQIVHTFEATPIIPYNNNNGVQPTTVTLPFNDLNTSVLFSENGIGAYNFNINFLENPADTNPLSESRITTSDIRPQGQRVRGGSTNYSINNFSIVKTSDSTVTDVPIVTQQFTVSYDIESTGTPFSNSNTKVKVGIINIPSTVDNTQDFEGAFLYDRAVQTLGAGAIGGEATGDAASITNYTATFNSTSSVTVSYDVLFTANAQTQINLNSTPNFGIYTWVQDHLTDYTNSDRVCLEVFLGAGIQKVLVDPITVQQTRFLKAPFSDLSSAVDNTDLDGFPVELLVGTTRFSADWTDRTNLRIQSIAQSLVLKNSSTGEEVDLGSTLIPVNSLPLINNEYPSANYQAQRGFKIPNTETRNLITLDNDGDAGNIHFYQVRFPFFIRWEDYTPLILNNIPPTLIDSNEPNGGLNYDLYRIDQLANWSVNYRLSFTCEEDGQFFNQEFDTEIPTTDYDAHPQVTSRVINSFKEDGVTSLTSGGTKYIESTEKTLIVGEWTLSSAPSSVDEFEIEFYIEAFENGSPTKIQRISSVNGLLSSSWFTDTGSGTGLVAKSIDGSKAVGKVYIDNQKLVKFDNYRLYGTFYNPPKEATGFITESGDNLITEDSNDLILE